MRLTLVGKGSETWYRVVVTWMMMLVIEDDEAGDTSLEV